MYTFYLIPQYEHDMPTLPWISSNDSECSWCRGNKPAKIHRHVTQEWHDITQWKCSRFAIVFYQHFKNIAKVLWNYATETRILFSFPRNVCVCVSWAGASPCISQSVIMEHFTVNNDSGRRPYLKLHFVSRLFKHRLLFLSFIYI